VISNGTRVDGGKDPVGDTTNSECLFDGVLWRNGFEKPDISEITMSKMNDF